MSNQTRKSLRSALTRAAEATKPVSAPKLLSMEEAAQVSGGRVDDGFSPVPHRPGLPAPTNPTSW